MPERIPAAVWPQGAAVAVTTAVLVVGSVLPWFASELGTAVSAPLTGRVLTVLAAVATLWLVVVRPGLAWLPALVAVVAGGITLLVAGPGTTCWDGVDAAGNPFGGCARDVRTAGSWVFGAGLALHVLATAAVVRSARHRRRTGGPSISR